MCCISSIWWSRVIISYRFSYLHLRSKLSSKRAERGQWIENRKHFINVKVAESNSYFFIYFLRSIFLLNLFPFFTPKIYDQFIGYFKLRIPIHFSLLTHCFSSIPLLRGQKYKKKNFIIIVMTKSPNYFKNQCTFPLFQNKQYISFRVSLCTWSNTRNSISNNRNEPDQLSLK